MIAICIGHSRHGDKGAVSVGGVSEHSFNFAVANLLEELLEKKNIHSQIIHKYEGAGYAAAMSWVAGKVREIKATAAIELHFNSATAPEANGHEYLYWGKSFLGYELARSFADAYKDYFPASKPRRINGVMPIYKASERGGQFLKKTHCPAIVCEPFFGSNQHEWTIARNDPSSIAEAYASGIENYLLKFTS